MAMTAGHDVGEPNPATERVTSGYDWGATILFCPGDRPERFAKALNAGADSVLLDLEDGLGTADPRAAVAAVARFVAAHPQAPIAVRMPLDDPVRSPVFAPVLQAGVRAVVLPKCTSPRDVRQACELIESGALKGQVMSPPAVCVTIETASGVRHLYEICEAHLLVSAVSWGPFDLAADLGLTADIDFGALPSPIRGARDAVLLAAAATGITPLDTVTPEIEDQNTLFEAAQAAAGLGFRGKFVIHPRQVDPVRRAFRPAASEVEAARRVLAAGRAAQWAPVIVNGSMADRPMYARARQVVASAEQGSR